MHTAADYEGRIGELERRLRFEVRLQPLLLLLLLASELLRDASTSTSTCIAHLYTTFARNEQRGIACPL